MDGWAGKRILILGLARQGKALARFAVGAGAKVVVSDLREAEALQAEMAGLADLPIAYVLGKHPLGLLEEADVVALSGSVPADAPFVQAARERGVAITNDSLEFVRRCSAPTVGITGSAGKTTTTSLLGEMGKAAGRKTWVGGNIGRPLIPHVAEVAPKDLVVQELSSFQLELWDRSPQVAAVLNVTPNHLDRHKTMAAYSAAKANIVRYQKAGDVAVLCLDEPGSVALRALCNGRVRLFSQEKRVADGAFVAGGQVWLADGAGGETAVCHIDDILLRGKHNIYNVLAACVLADSAGLPVAAMRGAIGSFSGVAHRLEETAVVDGVRYVNDSIATAPERALAALAAFEDEPIVLLAGGQDKDMVWDVWAKVVCERVRAVVLFGALAPMLAERLAHHPHCVEAGSLEAAVVAAKAIAEAGDVVLLAPGGTSYDAFVDFAARGERFAELVGGDREGR